MEPTAGQRIDVGDPRVAAFPDPSAVFVAEQPWLARLLHPLVSVDLAALDPAWTGRVHVLSPVEPEDGLLGEETADHHDEYAGENWISFHLDEDSRYRFLGDRRFFQGDAALPDLYAQAETEFGGAKARWSALGALTWGDKDDPTKPRAGWATDSALLDELGGRPGYGNWASFPPPAAFRLDEEDDETPVLRLADGRPFTYVAGTAGYPWRNSGADAILVFFEPETRTVALTFDWS